MRITIDAAKAAGYIVDTCCYPPYAYKGERFSSSSDFKLCFTPMEAALIEMLQTYADAGHMHSSERSRFERLKKGSVR